MTVLLATAWTVIILVLCLIPGNNLPEVKLWEHTDKLIHFTLFFVLQMLWGAAFPAYKFKILLLASVYGIAIELIQHNYIPFRSFDVWDWVADTAGALVASIIFKSRR